MGSRKKVVKNRVGYGNLLTKFEGGLSQVRNSDVNELLKKAVRLDAALTVAGYKSELVALRREAIALAKKEKAKLKKLMMGLK